MVLSDHEIRALAQRGMISDFADYGDSQPGKISWGLSSYGYDCRLADEFKVFTNVNNAVVDPKNFDPSSFIEKRGDSCLIPPNSFILGRSLEHFDIPRDILVLCIGKSSYARCGIICNVTPLEPAWSGAITLELSNSTPLPARVYANEGICQLVFIRSSSLCEISYADRHGVYQGQTGITLPRVRG